MEEKITGVIQIKMNMKNNLNLLRFDSIRYIDTYKY